MSGTDEAFQDRVAELEQKYPILAVIVNILDGNFYPPMQPGGDAAVYIDDWIDDLAKAEAALAEKLSIKA